MRVLLVSDFQNYGGAAIAAGRQASALRSVGCEVFWAAGRAADRGPTTFQFTDGPLARYAAERLAARVAPALAAPIEQANRIRRIEQIIEQVQPDIINVHNLHGAGLPADLPWRLALRRPVVWTLHDMWSFTGGCAYSFDCRQFAQRCDGTCPHANEGPAPAAKRIPAEFERRRKATQLAEDIIFASPSRWLAVQAGAGLWRGQKIRVIPYSLDLTTFAPMDPAAAAQRVGIASDRPIVLTVGVNDRDTRKGLKPLTAVLHRLPQKPITWVSVGGTEVALPAHVRQINLTAMRDERLLRLAYCAAVVHVLPTLADNLPNTLLEAAACGTPSVAFAVGGVPEAVVNDVTGLLVSPGDATDLARMLERAPALPQDQGAALRDSSREFAVIRYAPALQAQRDLSTFEQLLHPRRQGRDEGRIAA